MTRDFSYYQNFSDDEQGMREPEEEDYYGEVVQNSLKKRKAAETAKAKTLDAAKQTEPVKPAEPKMDADKEDAMIKAILTKVAAEEGVPVKAEKKVKR